MIEIPEHTFLQEATCIDFGCDQDSVLSEEATFQDYLNCLTVPSIYPFSGYLKL
jgi:hypothetical protein